MTFSVDLFEQPTAISSNHFGQFCPLLLFFGHAKITETSLIPLCPCWVHVRKQPIWRDFGKHIERVTHGLSNTFEPTQRANGCQHVGRIGPLLASSLDPPTLAAQGE